jgi:hypothetical protein
MRILAFMNISSLKKFSGLHYWATALLMIGLVPCLRRMNLPLKFDWIRLSWAYWIVLAAHAIFLATVLCVVGFEPEKSFGPMLRRFKDEKLRIIAVLAFFFILHSALTWHMTIVLTVDTVAMLEFFQRIKPENGEGTWSRVLLPAVYLFVGWLLIFAYNDITVSARFFAARDAAFNAADIWLLHGISVSQICHWAVRVFPISVFHFLEFIYFGMFSLLGAGMILVSICDGTKQGLRFVGTVLLPSYVALILFYLWTSQGPYYLCPTHFTDFPRSLKTYSLQRASIDHARALWEHVSLDRISGDYFIAFPCMHISTPLIVTWFLRRWKRLLALLLTYDVVLIIAIVLLEWHYVVDIIAGILLAGASIMAINYRDFWQQDRITQPV